MIMGCGIYKITNKIDKKVYIGSSLNISSRHYKHFWLLDAGHNVMEHPIYRKQIIDYIGNLC